MNTYANIRIQETNMIIRFERVGNPERFKLVLESFHKIFPLASWSQIDRAWVLPLTQLSAVIEFCDQTFGSGHIYIRTDNNITTPARQFQMPLF